MEMGKDTSAPGRTPCALLGAAPTRLALHSAAKILIAAEFGDPAMLRKRHGADASVAKRQRGWAP